MADFWLGASALFTDPTALMIFVGGLLGGMLFGAIPGINMLTLGAVVLPFTAAMEPAHAIMLYSVIYCSGVFGGAIPAIEADLLIGNSGTTVRFLTAMLTLGHGAFRLDNLFFGPAGSVEAVFDWQVPYLGPAVLDIGDFLGGSFTVELVQRDLDAVGDDQVEQAALDRPDRLAGQPAPPPGLA